MPALVLLAAGALLFGMTHVRPWGPAGMAAFLAGSVWVELHASRDESAAEARDAEDNVGAVSPTQPRR